MSQVEQPSSSLPVLFETLDASVGKIGIATLHSPGKLNSLTLEMVELLGEQLQTWESDAQIGCVVLRSSNDKAFCAGADIRQLNASIGESQHGERLIAAERFFEWEYRLDYLIHCYSKPLIAWGHGIVMGGGLGLFAGAGFRVVTDSSQLAMPEVTIGLFPDVGASWFLNKMPAHLGCFIGLTAARLNAADALYAGLADIALPHIAQKDVLADLQQLNWRECSPFAEVSRVLQLHSITQLAPSHLQSNYGALQSLAAVTELGQFEAGVEHLRGQSDWLRSCAQAMQAGSPMTRRLVMEQLFRGRYLSLADCFRMEWSMAVQACQQGEFSEGVRALLIDKDKSPQWRDADSASVPDELFWRHFKLPRGVAENPLADLQ